MNRVAQSHLQVTALSHEGMKGKNNEDRYAVTAFEMEDKSRTPVLLAVLSDGIGGHQAGEVAAEIAVNHISEFVAASSGGQPVETLVEAIQSASQEIYFTARMDGGRKGMGGTCACALVIGSRLYTANVGDSRIYLIRGASIQQVSTDHTWLQEALEAGLLKPEEIEGHPNQHIIRRYLGSAELPQVDTRLRLNNSETAGQSLSNQGTSLKGGDIMLLCSDGLTDLVKDHEILQSFRSDTLEASSQYLVNLANERGGHDNITVVAFQVPEIKKSGALPLHTVAWAAAALVLAGVVIAILFFGWMWMNQQAGKNASSPTPSLQASSATQLAPALKITVTPAVAGTKAPTLKPTFSIKELQLTLGTPPSPTVDTTDGGRSAAPSPSSPLPGAAPAVDTPSNPVTTASPVQPSPGVTHAWPTPAATFPKPPTPKPIYPIMP